MAGVRNFWGPEFRFRGLCTGMWAGCVVDLDQHESAGAAAAAAAGAAACMMLPPPANVVLAAIVGSYAEELVQKRGPNGVSIDIGVNIVNPGCNKVNITGK
jgi:hypothetical protein